MNMREKIECKHEWRACAWQTEANPHHSFDNNKWVTDVFCIHCLITKKLDL